MKEEGVQPERQVSKSRSRKVKPDDTVGEFSSVQDQPPWAQSSAYKALRGDTTAYDPEQVA